ncbi:MAG: hypothetical protein E6H96_10780, partial [Chloroflexi bacterium]
MPAEERIAENLAYINWTVLTGLAVGAFAAVLLGRLRTDATRGFLAFTALCAGLFGILAYLSDSALPSAVPGSAIVSDPAFDAPRRAALAIFAVVALAYVVVIARRGRAPALGLTGLGAGIAALLAGALGWGGGFPAAVPLFLQLLVLTAATGGVFAAMILGHW